MKPRWSLSLSIVLAAAMHLSASTPGSEPGSLDDQFLAPFFRSAIWALYQDEAGKVWAGGGVSTYDSWAFAPHPILNRMDATGAVDPTFRGLELPGYLEPVRKGILSLLSDPQGRLLACGKLPPQNMETESLILFRLLPDGRLDPSYSGVKSKGIATSMIWDSSGRLLLGGNFTQCNGQNHTNLLRLLQDGTIDSSFHLSLEPADDPGNPFSAVRSLTADEQGRIYVAGLFQSGGPNPAKGLMRLLPDGQNDPQFTSQLRAGPEAVCPLRDGRILVGAYYLFGGAGVTGRVFRLEADGRIDRGFDSIAERIRGPVYKIKLDSASRPWIVGYSVNRLRPDGSWDPSFRRSPAFENGGNFPSLLLDRMGNALVGGSGWTGTNRDSVHHTSIVRVRGGDRVEQGDSPLQISYQRPSSFSHQGDNLTVEARVSNGAHAKWQWYQNDSPLFRQTNAQLLLPDLSTNQVGWYRAMSRMEDGSEVWGDSFRLIVYPDSRLGKALDTPDWVWVTAGIAWHTQETSAMVGPSCARNVIEFPNELNLSWLETKVQGPGVLEYWDRVEATGYSRSLLLEIDDRGTPMRNGPRPWNRSSINVPSGIHKLRWIFESWASDLSPHEPGDGAFLDGVTYATLPSLRPQILVQPRGRDVEEGSSASLFVFAEGGNPLTYVWRKDGVRLAGSKRQSLNISQFSSRHAGLYSVVISNQFSSVTSAVVELKLVSPQPIDLKPQFDRLADSSLPVQFQTEPGAFYQVQQSRDLTDWSPLQLIPARSWSLQFDILINKTLERSFYRVVPIFP